MSLSPWLCVGDHGHGIKWRIVRLLLILVVFTKIFIHRAKYPLAITSKLLEVFGPSFALGYDIGCQFSRTIHKTSLAELAIKKSLHSVVPGFHGYGHNRLCQLSYHPLYVTGMGLEDLEGCERAFSRSNEVAKVTRYASRFHRQQAIVNHFRQWDSDKYLELCMFICMLSVVL